MKKVLFGFDGKHWCSRQCYADTPGLFVEDTAKERVLNQGIAELEDTAFTEALIATPRVV